MYYPVAITLLVLGVQGLDPWTASKTQLDPKVDTFTAVAFGNAHEGASTARARCKAFPGDLSWPKAEAWHQLNKTIGGALLAPLPAASVCYTSSPNFNSETCSFLTNNASQTSFYLDDSLSILNQWPQGNTCLLEQSPAGNCTQGGYPTYVINATSVKHVQAAVNFARNNNVRLVIKLVFPPELPLSCSADNKTETPDMTPSAAALEPVLSVFGRTTSKVSSSSPATNNPGATTAARPLTWGPECRSGKPLGMPRDTTSR